MESLVAAVIGNEAVPDCCCVKKCKKEKSFVSMENALVPWVIVDFDCKAIEHSK